MPSERCDLPNLRPGDLLERRYEIEAPLGAGGTGRVFRARDLVTKGTVAIKLMDPEWEADPTKVAFFAQEGRLAARIRDRHLIAAWHFGLDAGRRFIVYDYMPGAAPLAELAEEGRLPWRRVCNIAVQILYGLDALHQAGIVHGDVSPNNCLWRERKGQRDEIFLIDLGQAWTRPPCPPMTDGPIAPPEEPGTEGYRAPEVVHAEEYDHRSDLWSVGAVMYAMLLFREVDRGEDDGDELLQVVPPAIYLPTVPQAISDVVMRALAGVDQRYPSAMAMADAIQTAVASADLSRRRGVPVWASVGGMVLAGVLGVFATWTSMAAAPAPPQEPMADVKKPNHAINDSANPPRAAPTPTVSELGAPEDADLPATPPNSDASVQVPSPSTNTPPAAPQTRRAERVLTWSAVERLVNAKAAELRPCSTERFMALGLRVEGGRATLESLDATPVERPRDDCAVDVVKRLRFAKGGPLVGVVGVKLPAPRGSTSR